MTTKRARMSSPRLVLNRQRLIDSSQRTSETWVEKIAPSYSPKCLPMLRQCPYISAPWAYFFVGM